MKIAYIANHRGLGNDDEGSIAYALESLGHSVLKIQEYSLSEYPTANQCDFALFHHHWNYLSLLNKVRIPKGFWFFDLIHHPDIPNRHGAHLRQLTDLTDIGFCSDGYWADENEKVHHLFQGADPRIVGTTFDLTKRYPIFFAGSLIHQIGRAEQYNKLAKQYGRRFIGWSSKHQWVYGKAFSKAVSKAKIVVSLKSPTKDDYWSNRVFVVAGFGGFQLHPYCRQLVDYYKDGEEIVYYHSPEDLIIKIDHYLLRAKERKRIGDNALERTREEHTYVHRCKQMLEIVERELL